MLQQLGYSKSDIIIPILSWTETFELWIGLFQPNSKELCYRF